MKYVSEAAEMDEIGLRTYRVDPGEEIPLSGLHYHDEQEEVFYVIEGTLSVETPDEIFHVEEGQFLAAEPGSAHRAHNADDSAGTVSGVGMGAPPVTDGLSYDR